MLSFFISVPAVRLADRNHRAEDVVPRLLVEHRRIGEHTAVPADVLEGAGRLPVVAAHPGARVAHDVELPIRVERRTVAAGLVVRSFALDRAVVLRDVEVDGP